MWLWNEHEVNERKKTCLFWSTFFCFVIYFLKIFIVIFRFQTKTHIWISKQVVHFLFPLNNPYFTVVLVLFLVCNHYLDYHLTVIPEGLRHATVQVFASWKIHAKFFSRFILLVCFYFNYWLYLGLVLWHLSIFCLFR